MGIRDISRHATNDGRVIYRLPLEVFPGFFGNAYVVTGGERPILVDTGSGQDVCNKDLVAGFEQVRERFGEPISFADLGAIVLTHGHIDHFGGLRFLRHETEAPVHIHVLDQRVVSGYGERVVMASRHIETFFASAGVDDERRPRYMETYLHTKALFDRGRVDVAFEEGPVLDGQFEAIHVPGHCPGQVCLRLGDVLLTADHVLAHITPHLSPEVITRHTGVAHYFASLDRVEALHGIRLGLGGHYGPIEDLPRRLLGIRRHHRERLDQVLELCAEPRTIVELSRHLFGRVESYHVLLAVLETGAHVEYLYDRGQLAADNVEQLGPLDYLDHPVILYRRT